MGFAGMGFDGCVRSTQVCHTCRPTRGRANMLAARDVKDRHSDVFTHLAGSLNRSARLCRVPEDACKDSLVYVTDPAQLKQALLEDPARIELATRPSEGPMISTSPRSRGWRWILSPLPSKSEATEFLGERMRPSPRGVHAKRRPPQTECWTSAAIL